MGLVGEELGRRLALLLKPSTDVGGTKRLCGSAIDGTISVMKGDTPEMFIGETTDWILACIISDGPVPAAAGGASVKLGTSPDRASTGGLLVACLVLFFKSI